MSSILRKLKNNDDNEPSPRFHIKYRRLQHQNKERMTLNRLYSVKYKWHSLTGTHTTTIRTMRCLISIDRFKTSNTKRKRKKYNELCVCLLKTMFVFFTVTGLFCLSTFYNVLNKYTLCPSLLAFQYCHLCEDREKTNEMSLPCVSVVNEVNSRKQHTVSPSGR